MLSHTVPVGNVLVGDTGGNIEHDDTALSVDIVPISQTTEFLLTSGIPHVEFDIAQVLLKTLVQATRETAKGRSGVTSGRGIQW